MSTARFDNWQSLAGGTTVAMADALAKAWANLNGTGTITLRDDFNVASVTDNATGHYTHSFTSSFVNTNYAASGMGEFPDMSSADGAIQTCAARSFVAVGSFRIAMVTPNGGAADEAHVTTLYVGDLA